MSPARSPTQCFWFPIATSPLTVALTSTADTSRRDRRHWNTLVLTPSLPASTPNPLALATHPAAHFLQHSQLSLLNLQLPQPLDLSIARPTVLHALAVYHAPPFAWVDPIADLALAGEVGEGDVEGVDVGRDDGAEEEDAGEEEVFTRTAEEADPHWREDDVDEHYHKSFEHLGGSA